MNNILGLSNQGNAPQLAVVIVRSDGFAWDFTQNKYVVLQAGGAPTAAQQTLMTRPISSGLLATMNFLNLPLGAYDPLGSFAVILKADASGNLIGVSDVWPLGVMTASWALAGGIAG